MPKKLTTEDFILKAKQVHGNKYIYDFVEYLGYDVPTNIICRGHGLFYQKPDNHLSGCGCPKCAEPFQKPDFNKFLTKATKLHGDHYQYFEDKYINFNEKTPIKCKIHNNIFFQLPYNHLKGNGGCKRCSKQEITLNDRINEFNKVHNFIYDYSEITVEKYKHHAKIFNIICHKHNKFNQLVFVHLQGHGCPACGAARSCFTSKSEKLWLDTLFICQEYRQYIIKVGDKRYNVDAFDPETNIIYEFYGDYWHGNPNKYDLSKINKRVDKSFQELYDNTMQREETLKTAGYSIISIWESDWSNSLRCQK